MAAFPLAADWVGDGPMDLPPSVEAEGWMKQLLTDVVPRARFLLGQMELAQGDFPAAERSLEPLARERNLTACVLLAGESSRLAFQILDPGGFCTYGVVGVVPPIFC